jgi:prevent-host-death family protein
MDRIRATEAARRFADLLDAIEHRGRSFLITRNGRPVARISPASEGTGRVLKEILAKYPVDRHWAEELRDLRSALVPEERSWTD